MKGLQAATRAVFLLFTWSTVQAQERPGEEIYNGVCIICHGTGRHDAPRFGSVEDWRVRSACGLDELVPSAMSGVGRMPPMGANPALSDLELARAVIYMLNAAGGGFAEPTAEDLRRWRGVTEERRRRAHAHPPGVN